MAVMGRPRTFDRDKAIDEALQLFWQNGFEATSLSQLKAAMGGGISAPSFYAAFGSKEALFQECVQRYLETYAQVTECLWDTDMAPRDAIETALRQSARMQYERGHPKGCMVGLGVMSAPSDAHASVSIGLTRSRSRTRKGFIACVQRGIDRGDLDASIEAQGLAAVFDAFLMGLSVLARDGVRLSTVEAGISHVMLAWDAAARSQRGAARAGKA
ncbi:TetR/AcrR family transcriptional regulator [Luteibacter sp. UNCMF366Tsu5.1]|uniref:TetR/AcrR family transcriptional regulator n=1 Tax=Luteibacter sp. UNCMF366Tsu5.1 TaxID=1502758 RepID=UPI000908573A|nr:TetR/AcrR family transcriptional regulator [Luteibacter sp. UNCMF366Tsu5.1]SFW23850.1 transcriptional regulator, TetR family [Luteibacter sp. UNCMF366Tsu5.1]